jgi:hypothetical protein
MRGALLLAAGLVWLTACSDNPVAPTELLTVQLMSKDSLLVGAPGRALGDPVILRVMDGSGQPEGGASVTWNVAAGQGRLARAEGVTGTDGTVAATWVLGTRADEIQRLDVTVRTRGRQATAQVHAAAVPTDVAGIGFVTDTNVIRLGVPAALQVQAVDSFGNRFVPGGMRVEVPDTAVGSVDASGRVLARRRGYARVIALAGTAVDTAWVHVTQVVQSIVVDRDTLEFTSIGDTLPLRVTLLDDVGQQVLDSLPIVTSRDDAIASVNGPQALAVRSVSNGIVTLELRAGSVIRDVVAIVGQVPTSVTAALAFDKPIVTLAVGAALPLSCRMLDGKGNVISGSLPLLGSATGTVTGTSCNDLTVRRSGTDTLTFGVGSVQTRVPVVIAAAPVAAAPLGAFVVADTLPGLVSGPWAPSARRNSKGQLEVYYTAYSGVPDSSGSTRGDMQRLVWLGGNQFRYDGMALAHDDDICSPQGQGLENMVVVPRADGPGWRMLYAAGSNSCYGWQVFSAVSTDERTWTKEPGIRVSNGGTAVHGMPPWPAGEGLVVDRLPGGGWRMIAGTYEHVDPFENKWQITEWRSWDQLTWTYIKPVMTTRNMPAGWQGSVYSPAIRQIGPGVWRMLYAADGRNTGGRSAIWSAVSTDHETWQIEGEVLGGVNSNLYYSAMVDDQVVFIRRDGSGPLQLAIATVTMP